MNPPPPGTMVKAVGENSVQARAEWPARRAELDAAIRDDRDRIAIDLHDSVIQRVFATAMSVESLRMRLRDADRDADFAHIVDELDRCIVEIRSVIYRLDPDEGSGGFESDLLTVLEEERPALALSPAVHLAGDLASVVGERRHHVVAIFRELLSNVAQHAHASPRRGPRRGGRGDMGPRQRRRHRLRPGPAALWPWRAQHHAARERSRWLALDSRTTGGRNRGRVPAAAPCLAPTPTLGGGGGSAPRSRRPSHRSAPSSPPRHRTIPPPRRNAGRGRS